MLPSSVKQLGHVVDEVPAVGQESHKFGACIVTITRMTMMH